MFSVLTMDFPIQSLIDEEQAEAWVLNHFHPKDSFAQNAKRA